MDRDKLCAVLEQLRENLKCAMEEGQRGPANRALDLLGKHLGMFTDKLQADVVQTIVVDTGIRRG